MGSSRERRRSARGQAAPRRSGRRAAALCRADGDQQLLLSARGLAPRGTGRPRRVAGTLRHGALRPQQLRRGGAGACGDARAEGGEPRLPLRGGDEAGVRRRHPRYHRLSHRPGGLRAPVQAADHREPQGRKGQLHPAVRGYCGLRRGAAVHPASRRGKVRGRRSRAHGPRRTGPPPHLACRQLQLPGRGPQAPQPAGRPRLPHRGPAHCRQRRALPRPEPARAAGRGDLHPRAFHHRRGRAAAAKERRAPSQACRRDGEAVPRAPGGHRRDAAADRAHRLLARRPALQLSRGDRRQWRDGAADARTAGLGRGAQALPQGEVPGRHSVQGAARRRHRIDADRANELRAILPHRARSGALRPRGAEHPLPGARLGGQFGGLLLPRGDRGRPHGRQPGVRPVPLHRAAGAARHRRRLRARAARRGDAVPLHQVHPCPHRPHRHRGHLPLEGGDARSGKGLRTLRGRHRGDERAELGLVLDPAQDRAGQGARPRSGGADAEKGARHRRRAHGLSAPPLPACGRVRDHPRPARPSDPHRQRGDGRAHRGRMGQERPRRAGHPQGRYPGAGDAQLHPPLVRADAPALWARPDACRGARRGARGPGAPLARRAGAERPRLCHDAQGRHRRRVPDRKPGADVDAAPAQAQGILRPRHRGGDRAARPDPGRHGAPLSQAPAGHREAGGDPARTRRGAGADAGDPLVPGAGDADRHRRSRLHARRGRSATPRHGHLAAQRQDRAVPRTLPQRHGGARLFPRVRRALLQADRGFWRIRLPRKPRGLLRAPRLCLVLAQVPLPGCLRLRPAQQPADGLLRPGADRARRHRARGGGARGRRQPLGSMEPARGRRPCCRPPLGAPCRDGRGYPLDPGDPAGPLADQGAQGRPRQPHRRPPQRGLRLGARPVAAHRAATGGARKARPGRCLRLAGAEPPRRALGGQGPPGHRRGRDAAAVCQCRPTPAPGGGGCRPAADAAGGVGGA